jgi:hypothetical protein
MVLLTGENDCGFPVNPPGCHNMLVEVPDTESTVLLPIHMLFGPETLMVGCGVTVTVSTEGTEGHPPKPSGVMTYRAMPLPVKVSEMMLDVPDAAGFAIPAIVLLAH